MQGIPTWAGRYIGVRFVPGGRTLDGLDCWGLCALVLREEAGVELPSYDGPNWVPDTRNDRDAVGQAAQEFADRFTEIPQAQARTFDAVLLRVMGWPMHVGVLAAPGLMLHADEKAGVVCERYTDTRWRRRVAGFYRQERDA